MASQEPAKQNRVRSAIDSLSEDQKINLMFALMKKDILSSVKEADKKDWEGKLWTTKDDAKLQAEEKRVLSLLPTSFTEKEILEEKRYLSSLVPETVMTEERAAAELQPIAAEYNQMAWLKRAVDTKLVTPYEAQGMSLSMSADMMLGF